MYIIQGTGVLVGIERNDTADRSICSPSCILIKCAKNSQQKRKASISISCSALRK